ncbi:hypothetical protein O5A27_000304 [Listeria monocytogenes]|nr:nucleotidyltransferase [Listeria monocytogenes]EAG0986838.1 nucleotidyltransferase [Listeria monocytogenes]EAG5475581.1 nucleotidyltransferase [Listeria monocytogenes]ECP9694830.1 nucleotidyltransferase [Listeria monocytogenes]EGC1210642.1 nucleotidyltransferase [Listeria monocytogenes]
MGNYKYFSTLLSNIEPSKTTKSYVSSLQTNLREFLKKHDDYKSIHIDTFISGSYAKHTAIRPVSEEKKQDVDIIVITNYKKDDSPIQVLKDLKKILSSNKNYSDLRLQSKSIGIEMSNYHIDVVPVVTENNKFYIGNSKKNVWILTHPKKHISWATEVNLKNENKYKQVVKIFKWWRKNKQIKLPKGILLEKIIADNFGNPKYDIENLLITTMENVVDNYRINYIDKGIMPTIYDPVLIENNLLEEYSFEEFSGFVEMIEQDLSTLKKSQFSIESWNEVLINAPSKSNEEIQEEQSLALEIQMGKILDQVVGKSTQLSKEIKEYEEKKITVDKKEQDLLNKEDELKYNVYFNFISENVYKLPPSCIREIGPEYWLNIIKILNSINEKRGRTFWGYEYSYFAKIYKELDLFEEYYYSICHLVEADYPISIYDIEYIIKNTYYRTALIETLKANIKDGNASVTNKSFIEALKLLKES